MSNQPKNLSLQDKLTFGKYQGRTIEEVYKQNVSYLAWLRDYNANELMNRNTFAPEVHVLIDYAVAESKYLSSRFKVWGVTIDGIDPIKTTEQQMRDATSAETYSSWGEF